MTRKTKKEQALETRERILDAAEDVFNEKGVSQTALSDIAKAASVTRGAIYWHFKNKSDVFDAMCDRVREPIREMVENMADEQTEDPLAKFSESRAFITQQIISNPHFRKVFTILFHKCEYLDENDPALVYAREWKTHVITTIEKVFSNAKEKGHLPSNLDSKLAAIMVHASFDGLLNTWLFMPNEFDLAETASRIHEANIHGMKANPALLKPA